MKLNSVIFRLISLLILSSLISSCGWLMRYKKPGRRKIINNVEQTAPAYLFAR